MSFNFPNNRTISGCCKECEDRYLGCHDHCDKYKAAKEDWEQYKESKKATAYEDYKFKAVIKGMIRRSKYGK